jgi:RimJ/RimL family protein N-acetyltransferase
MGERYAGQGYMQDAIQVLISHAFGAMRLHRIEAACIPANARSIRVLEKAGFAREGLLRSYLRINGTLAGPLHLLPDLRTSIGPTGYEADTLRVTVRTGQWLVSAVLCRSV